MHILSKPCESRNTDYWADDIRGTISPQAEISTEF
jgi:hypothetical protein